jgi:hypothetical protein
VLEHEALREILAGWRELTDDQRLVLASRRDGEGLRDCCSRTGWSDEKYRKVAQRARARLRLVTGRQTAAAPA